MSQPTLLNFAPSSFNHFKSSAFPRARFATTAVIAAVLLSACGGGGNESALNSNRFSAGLQPMTYLLALGTDADNTIVGADERTYLWGLSGNDTLVAGSMGSNLFGDSGNDVLVGKAGGDRLVGGKGNDRLYGGAGNDGLMGGEGDDLLDEGAGHGDLDGGPGNDTLIGGPGADAFAIGPNSGNDVIKDFTAGPGMFDHLAVSQLRWADLTIQDTTAGVKISWATGSVVLEGVRKADLAQDDFMFQESPDLPPGLRAPSGPSTERPSPSTPGPDATGERLGGQLASDVTFQGDERYRVAIGGDNGDQLTGTDAWDHFIGKDGNDTLDGGAGDDVLEGNAGDDVLIGGAGRDKLDGGPGNDRLSGGDDNDEIMGGDGDDVIDAGSGHDMIEGGKGNDTITGGAGADAFIVRPDSGNDVVLDFEATGAAQGAFDHIAFMDILPEQVKVTDTADGALVSWDTNGDGTAEGSVLLKGVPMANLRQSDFMFNARPGFVTGISTVGSYYIFPAE
jgi:serralysin